MIVEWLITVAAGFVSWIGTLFPDDGVPGWLTNLDTNVNDWFAQWDGVGVWADWGFLASVVAIVLGWWLTGFLIKLVRTLLGHIPEFGGNG